MRRSVAAAAIATVLVTGLAAAPASAYSVLTHEAAIDAVWDSAIRPLLARRFPQSTSAAALARARSFAYGGSVIQDLGYYPFGSHFFSNLLHYVRSGDFVARLIRDAGDVDEYAFALGALAHYANDNTGHPEAVNRAVPLVYPKIKKKFGDRVTYVQAPGQHVIVEFSFDVVQAAGGAYLPQAYREFVGFRVATPLLERAFRETYDLDMKDVFGDEDQAISTYRYSVSQLIPALTKAAWRDKHEEIQKLTAGMQQKDFIFSYGRADYDREYGRDYKRPGLFARFVGFLYRLVPKIGPLKPLSFKVPTPEVETLFTQSFRAASARYRASLADVGDGRFTLANTDFDTGRPAAYGEYTLADETYAELIDRLSRCEPVSLDLVRHIRGFYGQNPAPSSQKKKDRQRLQRTQDALGALEARARHESGPDKPDKP